MKKNHLLFPLSLITILIAGVHIYGQDSTEAKPITRARPVKNTFESVWLIDNQTVMVPIKGTFEFDIQHRFGTIDKGRKDLWGFFAPSNIRLGISYAPVKNLVAGAGITKERMQIDANAKYALMHQTPGQWPVSISIFGNAVLDARNKKFFLHAVNRYSYFSQLIIARKFTTRFSAQVSPNFSWFNNVEAYVDSKGAIRNKMYNHHFSFSVLGRFKVSTKSSVIAGYDQPLTDHPTNNPHPNICFGFETTTSAHAFQVFFTNYYGLVPQGNNMYNQNDFRDVQFVIGFNITRLWNF